VVFIIGSGRPDFKEDIDAIAEILDGFGFKGYFALLSEEAKGLDAFCDKICSKIREAQFCVAMLNDPVVSRHIEGTAEGFELVRVPSANVYYEFGMAVAFGKSVIPVIRSGSKLPFDIQHLDAIVYDNVNDLKRKLKKSIVATLKKKTREVVVASNSDLVKVVYGPLYNEVDRFLSRRDKIATLNRSEYGTILTQHKYLLDTIDADLHKKITTFYDKTDELNSRLPATERIIHGIVIKQISDTFKIPADDSLSISVELETDSGRHILPTLDQTSYERPRQNYFCTFKALVKSSEKSRIN
jgi:hypothetical protein